MKTTDYITRFFPKQRGRWTQYYPYRTYQGIFEEGANSSSPLLKYMSDVFKNPYQESDKECSTYKVKDLLFDVEEIESILVWHARKSNYMGKGRQQHDICQRYLIKNDPYCIATEIPMYNSDLCGFMDILRVKDDIVQIVDFKPHAATENKKKVANQLYNYRKILSEHIDIDTIECIYFDHLNCYKVNYTI